MPEAHSPAHDAGDLLPGFGISQARESLEREKREGGSTAVKLPESVPGLVLSNAAIQRPKRSCRCHLGSSSKEQVEKRQHV